MDMPGKPSAPSPKPTSSTSGQRLLSSELFKGSKVVEIDHAGQRYLLRVTRENKLILTK